MRFPSVTSLLPRPIYYLLVFLLVFTGTGCGGGNSDSSAIENKTNKADQSVANAPGSILIELDKSDAEMLLAFYIGGMLPDGLQLDGVLTRVDSAWWLHRPKDGLKLPPSLENLFEVAGGDKKLTWEEFEPAVSASYYEVRNAPKSVVDMKTKYGDWNAESWFAHELVGQMTHFRRRLSVPKTALIAALNGLTSLSDPIIYPVGTVFVGEHLDAESVREVTAMVKREDAYWDYFAYGSDGKLSQFIEKKPDPLRVPTQCVGCHFGDRLFEPERSFPSVARPGPNGERAYFVPEYLKNASLASELSEHARRSDHILGLYGTLYLAHLIQDLKGGTASEEEAKLVAKLGLN